MRILRLIIPCLGILAACNNRQTGEGKALLDTISPMSKKFELAYQNDGKITATSLDTLYQVSFGGATDAAISPDGDQLAYTVSDSSKKRSIWMVNMKTKSQDQLHVKSSNFYQAMFSPDGKNIAFSIFKNGIWKVGVIGSDNNNFELLGGASGKNYYAPTWKGNGELVMQDLDNLYVFGLDGKLRTKFVLKDLIGKGLEVASTNRFFYTSDGKSIVFNASNPVDKFDGLMGSVESIYKLDLASKAVSKISPTRYSVPSIYLTAKDMLIFSGLEKPFNTSKIYTSTVDGNDFKLLVDKGSNPSAN
ncbi:TolB protein [Pedobacter sp. UYEF25]